MRLGDLFDDAPASARGLEVTGITADSRKVAPGFVFAALKGVAAHGRDFIAQAQAAGAVAILSAGDVETSLPHITEAEPRRALALAAAKLYARQPQTIAAVTGTNGKSSTVDFLRQIWARSGLKAASLGTLGAIWSGGKVDLGHTTADPVAIHEMLQKLADEGVTHVAMEASSHGLDQHRLDGLRLKAGAFLNLTQDHLDYHQTMDQYRDAKLKLWSLVDLDDGIAVVNADSPVGLEFFREAQSIGLPVLETGWRANFGLKIAEILPRPNGQTLKLRWKTAQSEIEEDVDLPLIGEFQALNAVTAATLALALGMAPKDVWAGLEKLQPVKGRLEHIGATPAGAHVFVDYAHTPDGLDVLLRAARPHAPGRIVLVFGCGGDRDKTKRAKMGAVAAKHADLVIVTDDNPRTEDAASIRRQVLEGVPGAREIGDRAAAIAEAVGLLKAGDALLIAGKGHETGQIIGKSTVPFSDQDEARKALAHA